MNDRTDQPTSTRSRGQADRNGGGRVSSIPRDDLRRLLELRHSDPHSILGAHLTSDGAIIRAYRPEAVQISLLLDDQAPREMTARPEPGLFEVAVAEKGPEIFRHRLEILYPGNYRVTVQQPYSFPPTLGDLDLYLWAEQKHERIWQKMGAHVREVSGISGTSFAVWAPNAAGISVVGDFNGWDGRLHMMRMLGASGVWEIFIPDLGAGTFYKYEIRTQDGGFLLKSDPFAIAAECPPATASRVYQSSYAFNDDAWMAARANRDSLRSPMSIYEVHLGSWRRV